MVFEILQILLYRFIKWFVLKVVSDAQNSYLLGLRDVIIDGFTSKFFWRDWFLNLKAETIYHCTKAWPL